MITLDENEILPKLNELLEIVVHELQKYSTTSTCSQAKEGMEEEYNRYARIARLISELKTDIFFAGVFNPLD